MDISVFEQIAVQERFSHPKSSPRAAKSGQEQLKSSKELQKTRKEIKKHRCSRRFARKSITNSVFQVERRFPFTAESGMRSIWGLFSLFFCSFFRVVFLFALGSFLDRLGVPFWEHFGSQNRSKCGLVIY